jgi:hypothetical protein
MATIFTALSGFADFLFILHWEKLLKEFMDDAVREVKKKYKITPGTLQCCIRLGRGFS